MAPSLTQDEKDFVAGVSQQTGIDPRVLIAWIASEGHPGDMYHNYLNIQTPTAQSLGVQTVGTAAANTAEFGDVQTGIRATSAEIRSLGLTKLANESPSQEITDIAASPWASSHYGGPGGPNLRNTFASIFGSSALGSGYTGPGAAQALAGNFPTKIGDATSAVTGALSSGESAVKFLTSWRFFEVLGGFALLLVGLVLLGRQFGVSAPGAATVASRVPGA